MVIRWRPDSVEQSGRPRSMSAALRPQIHNEQTYLVRAVGCQCHVGDVCFRETQSMVRSCLCRHNRIGWSDRRQPLKLRYPG